MIIKKITPSWLTLGEPLNNKSVIRLFSEFLKRNGIYVKFKENSEFQKGIANRDGNFFYLFTNKHNINNNEEYLIRKLIDLSFVWSKTKEGHSFWAKVHAKWYITITQYNLGSVKDLF